MIEESQPLQLQMNQLSLRNNQSRFKTSGILPIILEESMKYPSNAERKTLKDHNMLPGWTWNHQDLEPTRKPGHKKGCQSTVPSTRLSYRHSQNILRGDYLHDCHYTIYVLQPYCNTWTRGRMFGEGAHKDPMVGENRWVVHYQPMDFPSWPVQISNHRRAIRL